MLNNYSLTHWPVRQKGINGTERRFIDFKASIAKGYLVIKITNAFNGIVQPRNGVFVSSKKNAGGGIGLSSVKTLAAKYHGQCFISFDQHVFEVSISLKLPETVAAPEFVNISG